MKLFYLVCILNLAIVYAPANSTEVVGRSAVNGKTVILYSDKTWGYEVSNKSTDECKILSEMIKFCDERNEWENRTKTSSNQIGIFKFTDGKYGYVYEESLGISDGFNLPMVRDAIIINAANATGVTKDEVVVLSVKDLKLKGLNGTNVVYKIDYKGTPIIYNNTILLSVDNTFQFVTSAISNEFGGYQKVVHNKFLNALEMR